MLSWLCALSVGFMKIGILAFQGDVAEHADVLAQLAVDSVEVRSCNDLNQVSGLIIPGGESTVMAKFLVLSGLNSAIQQRVKGGNLAVFGTCAGAILTAKEATGKRAPESLDLIDMTIERNAYGTQRDSFDAVLQVLGIAHPVACSFIRAPKITRAGDGVDILATYEQQPVLVRQGNVLAATCHPELRGETAIHALFISMCRALATQMPPSHR